ncbi:hypothetical protein ASPZODRAFT_439489 [Penicilliopsis zonata CBS 506.65]|uniref:Transcription factor domain-containing protein n=1 Tax=Penicilliopsis zonata CBS 506.65 TaxID=1073090 RepID=A0A1L9SX16_9EURO|nr:hypothetical protein ASPZODRAFT_439489 [Penicilliopsis zonata CBS 506.65]OJJ51631.1 hypothetical protein ASPZODRAFT_439489 [Penicilliopsis zonata CBS 506.65]
MTVPFEGKTKKSLDLISDFLLLLPVLCSSRQNTSVAWLVENLQHIWDTIVAENPDLPLNTATSPCGNRPADPWRLVPPAMQYSNFSTLISVVFYSLSWIMVLAKVSPQTDELDRLLLETHCDLVIYCATDQSIPTGVGYIWITLALRAVSATSPNRMQSEAAQSVIQDWGLRTALSDVLRNDLFGSFPLP